MSLMRVGTMLMRFGENVVEIGTMLLMRFGTMLFQNNNTG